MGAGGGDVESLAAALEAGGGAPRFSVRLGGSEFEAGPVILRRRPTHVPARTVRGGAYVSDPAVFRADATVRDRGILPLLPGAMLGPSAGFADVLVDVSGAPAPWDGGAVLHASLTSAVERRGAVEIRLDVTGVERA